AARLSWVEAGPVEPGERRDGGRAAGVEIIEGRQALGEMRPRAVCLEAHQPLPLWSHTRPGDVVLLHAEANELVLRQVDAAEDPVLGDVADDVDQLESDPERLGAMGLVGAVAPHAGSPHPAGAP